MTIIITSVDAQHNIHIVSDCVEQSDEGAAIVKKIYRTKDEFTAWAVAGRPPSREMITAASLEELAAAAKTWASTCECNQILIVEKRLGSAGAKVWCSSSVEDKFVLAEVQDGNTCIGSYRTEWAGYLRGVSQGERRYRKSLEFCALITRLSTQQCLYQDIDCGHFDELNVFRGLSVLQQD